MILQLSKFFFLPAQPANIYGSTWFFKRLENVRIAGNRWVWPAMTWLALWSEQF